MGGEWVKGGGSCATRFSRVSVPLWTCRSRSMKRAKSKTLRIQELRVFPSGGVYKLR